MQYEHIIHHNQSYDNSAKSTSPTHPFINNIQSKGRGGGGVGEGGGDRQNAKFRQLRELISARKTSYKRNNTSNGLRYTHLACEEMQGT